jgi:hypothetical protein
MRYPTIPWRFRSALCTLVEGTCPTIDWKDSTRDVYVNGELTARPVVAGDGDERLCRDLFTARRRDCLPYVG